MCLPEITGPAEQQDYLALLDRCLLDRQLSAHEAQALVQLAEELGFSRHRCELLHGEYFAALARITWADGLLTTDEMADLVDVANLFDISADALHAALDQPEQAIVVASTRHYVSRLCPQLILVPLRIAKCDDGRERDRESIPQWAARRVKRSTFHLSRRRSRPWRSDSPEPP